MFSKCKDEKEVKTLFRKLAMRLHPDYGGCNETMSLLKDAYDSSLAYVNSSHKNKAQKAPDSNPEDKKFYERVFDDVKEGDPKLRIITEIYAYAESHESFKIDTTEEINNYLEENGHITSQQYNRLVYIYYAFAMDKKKQYKKDTK
jgi:hypothetical protein